MCRMLGVVSQVPIPLDLLTEFRSLAATGKVPSDFDCQPVVKPGHPDGWGIGARSPDAEVYTRSPDPADSDERFERAVRDVRHLPSGPYVLLAHLRRVLDTRLVAEEHSLPFRREIGETVHYFAMDGWIDKFGIVDGGTDARWVCGGVLEAIGDEFTPKRLTAALDRVRDTARERYPRRLHSMTTLVTDGLRLLAHRDGGTCPLYFTLHLGKSREMVLVSSEVLESAGAKWRLLRNGETIGVDGDLNVTR